MRFLEEFLLCLCWRPAQAIEAIYWRMTRRRVRAWNCLRRNIGDAPYAYRLWIKRIEKPAIASNALQADHANGRRRPLISIVLTDRIHADSEAFRRSLSSVVQQSYPSWELLVPASAEDLLSAEDRGRITVLPPPDDEADFAHAVKNAGGQYVLRLRAGNQLPKTALCTYVAALEAIPQPSIVYGDQDQMSDTGTRQRPWFKPEWNSEMFLAQDYLSDACLIETGLARAAAKIDPSGRRSTPYSLLLAATAKTADPIRHVPSMLCHVDPSVPSNEGDRTAAVSNFLRSQSATAVVGPFDTVRVRWPLPETPPRVSIIVPTRDKVELLRACVSSVLGKTDYPAFELIIVDNQSELPASKDYFRELEKYPNVTVVSYDRAYNYSAINNFAVTQASGELLCLLNNDTEVITGDWLGELVRYAIKPEVGAIGAMLLYEDDTIQHAGVVIGIGGAAGHAHRNQDRSALGYFGRAHVPHLVSAVTAACLVVDRRKYEAVGGLDETAFGTAFNDVDFCLKLEKAGWRNVYAPQAMLYHYESKSRGSDLAPENVARYRRELAALQERWGTEDYIDPLHHLHLDRAFETYTIDLGKGY